MMLYVLSLVILAVLLWRTFAARHSDVEVHIEHVNDRVRSLVERCSSISAPYLPSVVLRNGHAMAVAGTLLHNTMHVSLRRELFRLADGGVLALDWADHENLPTTTSSPVLVVLHGLVGHSRCNYVQHFLRELVSVPREFRCVVMNARGCGDVPLRTPQGFTAGFTDDVRCVIQHLRTVYPEAPLAAVGYSLGANILVKYLGEEGNDCVLSAAVSVSNPFNLEATDEHMRMGVLARHVYSRRMAGTLKRWFKQHSDVFTSILQEKGCEEVMRAQTVREFDQAYVVPVYKFATVEEYYRTSSSMHSLSSVAVPLLALNALDDPICPPSSLPSLDVLRKAPNVAQVLTSHGSHVGWLEGWNPLRRVSWSDRLVLEFVSVALSSS